MYCSRCGRNVNDNERFCPSCGTELANNVHKAEVVQNGSPLIPKPPVPVPPVPMPPMPTKKSIKAPIIIISVVSTLIVVAILLTGGFLVAQKAGFFERDMTFNDVYEIAAGLEDGKDYEIGDFDKYESEITVNVYRSYSFEIDNADDVTLIITTDKETGVIMDMYLFCGVQYININEGEDAVREFVKENNAWFDLD